jgi:integrase/recombinase XerD
MNQQNKVSYQKVEEKKMVKKEYEKGLRKALSKSQVFMVIRGMEQRTPSEMRDKYIFELLWLTGIRVGELLKIEMSDILIKQGVLVVKGKGNRNRQIPIIGRVGTILMSLNTLRCDMDNDRLIQGISGKVLSKRYIQKMVEKAIREQAYYLQTYGPHILRHSFATHLRKQGVKVEVISKLLGHKALKTTYDYLQVLKEDELLAMKLMEIDFIQEENLWLNS